MYTCICMYMYCGTLNVRCHPSPRSLSGIPLVRLPMLCKMPFDLFKIYNSVRILGGFVTVSMTSQKHKLLKTCIFRFACDLLAISN